MHLDGTTGPINPCCLQTGLLHVIPDNFTYSHYFSGVRRHMLTPSTMISVRSKHCFQERICNSPVPIYPFFPSLLICYSFLTFSLGLLCIRLTLLITSENTDVFETWTHVRELKILGQTNMWMPIFISRIKMLQWRVTHWLGRGASRQEPMSLAWRVSTSVQLSRQASTERLGTHSSLPMIVVPGKCAKLIDSLLKLQLHSLVMLFETDTWRQEGCQWITGMEIQ